MWNIIWQRKHRRLRYLIINEVLLRAIIEGRIKGKAYRTMLSDLASSTKYPEVKRAAKD